MAEKKGFFAEFREFISRGNVMDMAVGVVVGGAFTSIVNSLVNDIIMPLVGLLIGKVNFSGLKVVFREATDTTEEAALYYGNFIQQIVNFLLVALALFLVIRAVNNARRKKEEAPAAAPQPSEEVQLLTEIRDELKRK